MLCPGLVFFRKDGLDGLAAELEEGGIVAVVEVFHDHVVVVDAEEVAGDLGFEHEAQVVVAMGGALGFEGFLFGVAHDTFLDGCSSKEAVEAEGVVVGKEVVEGLHLGHASVGIGPLHGEGVEETLAAEGDVVVGEAHGVNGHEDVGHDAAAAIDSAAVSRPITQGISKMYGVGIDKFAMFVALREIVAVGVGAAVVRALDAAAGGGVVACGGEAHLTAVFELHHTLHQSFAEGAATDNDAAVPVLDGAGEDFGCRGRAFVDEDGEAPVAEVATRVGAEVLAG